MGQEPKSSIPYYNMYIVSSFLFLNYLKCSTILIIRFLAKEDIFRSSAIFYAAKLIKTFESIYKNNVKKQLFLQNIWFFG